MVMSPVPVDIQHLKHDKDSLRAGLQKIGEICLALSGGASSHCSRPVC